MSLDATRWAWQQKIKATYKIVLLSLADRADEKHCCYPSIARLTLDTCLDRKTVIKSIQYLERIGLILAIKRIGAGNFYQLVGVDERHETSPKNGTTTKNGTSPKNGTATSPKNDTGPVPKTGHESTNNLPMNLS